MLEVLIQTTVYPHSGLHVEGQSKTAVYCDIIDTGAKNLFASLDTRKCLNTYFKYIEPSS